MAEKSIFRTLIRAEGISGDQIKIVVPAWNSELSFLIPMSILPDDLTTMLLEAHLPYRFHAKANLAAEEPEKLELHDFELT